MPGMTAIEGSHPLPILVFSSSSLWPISTGPKHLSLANISVTGNIYVNSMVRRLERNGSLVLCERRASPKGLNLP
jgi:hypothetical protein